MEQIGAAKKAIEPGLDAIVRSLRDLPQGRKMPIPRPVHPKIIERAARTLPQAPQSKTIPLEPKRTNLSKTAERQK
ncbi:hypothetical protein, partial [Mesorhizobium sp. M8A.F.Ca.ET.213.01.1.1]